MPSFQELVKQCPPSKEEERAFDLIIRFHGYCKLDQMWKIALSMYRSIRTMAGKNVTFHLMDGTEIIDANPGSHGSL